MSEEIALKKYKCLRCKDGHEWYPGKPVKPRICPKCKSKNWETPLRNDSDWLRERFKDRKLPVDSPDSDLTPYCTD